ncbi:serine/threonine-protein kinase [Streptomyces sp. WMMB303]|uniref:serine/threonine-protein kinase n=1 Tax=Streptomyces sp. WMMB303 TaxID=3034154 RepID=UPI0023ED967A|nr:serine/threonine-protein kinase [Streptomyces sp. WMMB303]MDF4249633.1 serine/threonine-protein kinase [Streptomyces sp. WMMB303]
MTDQARERLDVPAGYRVGEWELAGRLGAGSWGVVHAAQRAGDGAPAAVKLLPTQLLPPGQRASMAEAVRREARFGLETRHPNLVRIREVRTVHDPERPGLDGATALVMDRAELSLQERLESRGAEAGPLPDAARVLAAVGAGLAHIHERGWVHGDLKPGNVLLGPEGEVWLGDFGLTAELDGTHAYVPPLGSLDHVPPEWWSEREGGSSVLRPTADIWAFGVLAHQVLTGGLHPFPGGTPRARALSAQAYARGGAELRLHNGVPEDWRALITACLAPDHAARSVLGATELAARAREAAPGPGDPDRGPGGPGAGRSRRRLALLVAAVAVVPLAAGAFALLRTGEDPAAAEAGAPSARVSGAVPADSDVPRALRPVITRAALQCSEDEVTPAFLAAMLKAESGFDADARRPGSDEYGIAMWTPSVFKGWARDGDHDGDKSYMSPPDAIAAMSAYVCWLDRQYKKNGMEKELPALMAAGYRTSSRTVVEAGGVPARVRPHVERVRRYLAEYTR